MSVLSALSRCEQYSAWWGRGMLHFALLTTFTRGQHLCVHAWATSPALDTDHVAVGDSCENGKVYHDNVKVIMTMSRSSCYAPWGGGEGTIKSASLTVMTKFKALIKIS